MAIQVMRCGERRRCRTAWITVGAALAFAIGSSHDVWAETKTWTAGGITVTWEDADNWSSTGAPTDLDRAIFPVGGFAPPGPYPTITLSATSTANDVWFKNNYTLTAGTLTLTSGQVLADFSTDVVISSRLSGTAGLTKLGGGMIRLSDNANDFTGPTTISNGGIVVSGQGALGADSSTIRIGQSNSINTNVIGFPGGSLVLDGLTSPITITRNIDATGNGPSGRDFALVTYGSVTLAGIVSTGSEASSVLRNTRVGPAIGTLTLPGTLNVLGAAGTTITTLGGLNSTAVGNIRLSGTLAGVGYLEKAGSGTLFLEPAATAGFSGRFRVGGSASIGQSTVRVTSGTAADGTSIFGTANAGTTGAPIDMNTGVLEIRSDSGISFGKNVYLRGSSTFFAGPAPGGAGVSGTLTMGTFHLVANTTQTFNSRNGFGFTFGLWNQDSSTQQNTITNNMGGTLTFTSNAWNNGDDTARTLTFNGNGNTFIAGGINSGTQANKNLTKAGTGLLTIAGTATTLNNDVNIQAGAIMVTDFRSLNNNAGTINLGSTTTAGSLIFGVTGSAATAAGLTGTNKVIKLSGTTGGAGLYASQAGANPVLIQANLTATGAGAKTLTLGGTNAADNLISGVIPNNSATNTTALLKIGPGTWVVSGTNTYTGATTISDGTLKLRANSAADGVLPNANAITFNATNGYAGGTLEYQWVTGGNTSESLGALTPTAGANTIRLTPGSGTASLVFSSLGTIGDAATVNVAGATATSTVTLNGVATGLVAPHFFFSGSNFAYSDAGVLRAPVYGTDAGFVASPAGATIGTGQSNFNITGAITAQTSSTASTLRMSGNQSLTFASGSSVLTLQTGANSDGGILVTGGTSTITGGTISTSGSGALIVRVNGASDQLTIGSVLQSTLTGGINKTGTGVLILAAANAQTGPTNISQGTLRLSGAGVLSGNNVQTNIRQGATLDLGGVGTGSAIGEFINVGTVTNSASGTAATLTVGNNNGTGTSYGVMQDGAGVLHVTKVGTGAQSWLGLSTYTGTTRIGSTGLVTVDALADIGTASGIGRGNTSNNAGSLVFDGSTGGLVYAGNLRAGDPTLALGSTSASTNRLFTLAGTGARLSSTVTNNNAIVWGNTGAIVHGVVGPQLITFEGTSTGDNTFNPQLTDAGSGANITSVTKAGAGQWSLGSTNNTYTGATTLNEGILAINAAGALPGTSPLLLAPTSATSVAVFQASGDFTRALASGTVAGANTVTFGGSVASTTGGVGFAAHSSKLVVVIGGTAAPTALTWGSSGFVGTGATQVLVLNSTSALDEVEFRNPINLGASARTINVLDNTNTGADFGTLSGVLSGAGGSLRKIGAGILQVTGANTYTGTTSVEAGALVVSSLGSITSPANTPTSVGISGSGVAMTNANAILLGNASTTGANLVYAGAGEMSDRKIRFNSTTGASQIHANGAGPLVLTNVANDLGSGAKTLNLRGSNAEANMITSNLADNGGLLNVTVDGAATWILTGSNTYSGTTTAGGGALGIAASGLSPSSKLVITNGVMFAYGGDRTVGGSAADWANNTTAGFIGDYSLTFDKPLAWLASANNGTLTNNIVAGKTLTFAQGITANDITGNRTLSVDGTGTTVISEYGLTSGTTKGVVIAINGGGTLVLGGTANNFNQNGAGIDVDRGTLRMGGQNNAIRAQSGDGGLTLSPEVSTGDVATFDLAGTQQTVNALTATSDGTIIIDNSSATNASFTFGASGSAVNLFTSGTGTYSITDTGTGQLSIFKTGTAAFTMISGVTLDYSGTTGVTGGGMTLASAVAATTALSVSGSDSLLALTGGITNPGLITNVSVGAGSTLSLLDGVGNSLTNLNSLSLGIGGTAATVLRMNFGDSGSDTLGFVGGTLSLGGTESTSSVVTFYLTDIGASGNTRYDLITSSTGGLSSGTYSLGATPGGFSTFDLVTTDTAVYALSGDLITGKSFWTGSVGTAWNSGTANWAENQAGTIPRTSIPGSGSDVVFVADTVTTTGTLATTLEQNFRINSLSFQSGTGGTPSAVTIGPGTLATNRLEIAPQLSTGGTIGITMAADGPSAVTITAPFKLGAAQTWAVTSGSQTLTLSGPLLGQAAVTKSGAGTVVLSAAADPTFNSGTTTSVTVTSGTFVIQNAAALGSAANDNLASVDVSGGAFYYENATAGTVPNRLTLSGGALSASGTNQTYSGLVTVTAPSTIVMRNANSAEPTAAARNITLSGGLSGAGTLILDGNNTATSGNQIAGTLTLNQNNSAWTGNWDIRRGTVSTNNAVGLGGGSEIRFEYGKIGFAAGAGSPSLSQNVVIASSSTTSVGEFNMASGIPLTLSGTVTLGGAGGYGELRAFMNDDAAATLISGPVVLANNGGLSTQNAATRLLTVSGQISETGGARTLTINNATWGGTAGIVLLTNSNAYTGGTTLARGTLRVGDRDALGSGPLSVTAAATLNPVVDITGAAFLDQTLSLGGLLTASSTFGGLTFSGPIVNTSAGGISNSTNGTITITNNVFLSDNVGTGRTLTLAGSGLTVIDGVVANADGGGVAGNLTVTNTGTTRLTAVNTYSGTTTMNAAAGLLHLQGSNASAGATMLTAGRIWLDSATNGGLAGGTLTLTSGTLEAVNGDRSLSNLTRLTAATIVGGQSLAFTGTFTTNAANATLTNNLASGSVTLGTVQIADAITARTLTIAGTGATVIGTLVNNGANNTLTNSTTGDGSLAITNNVFLSDDIATGRTLTLAGSRLTVVDGVIADASGGGVAGNLTVTNTGTTRLTAVNTYSGTTTLTGGVIELANASNGGLGAGPLSLNGSTIQAVGGPRTLSNAVNLSASSTVSGAESLMLNGDFVGTAGNGDRTLTNNLTSGTLTIAGGLTVGGSTNTAAKTLTVAANAPTVITGPISLGVTPTGTFNNAFTKSGPALLSLTGNSAASSGTFGLTVNVNQGILQMTSGSLNTSATGTNGATAIGQAGSLKGVLDVAGGQYRASTLSAGNAAGGAGAIVVRGGTLATTTPGNFGLQVGGNTGYGYFGITSGSFQTNRISLYNAPNATGVGQVFGGGVRNAEYLILSNGKAEFTVAGGTVNRVSASNPLTLNYNQTSSINVLNLAGGAIDNTGQSVELGRSTTTGTAIMNIASGTLTTNLFTSGTAAGMLASLNFNGGVLRSSSSAAAFLVPATGSGSLSTIVNGPFGTFAGGAVIDTNGFSPTIGTSLVAPSGSGVSGLSVANAGSGYIGAPFVQIADEGGTGTGATGYAVVDLDPASATYGQLTDIVLTNPGINFTGTPTVTLFGGGGSGASIAAGGLAANTSGGLTKLSTGTLTLTGENTYTGLTTISAGALSIGSGGTAGSILGDVTNNASLIFNRSDASTYAGSITGSGPVTKAGAGTLTLSATHGYTGVTQVQNGTLRLVATNALPTSGTVQLGNASTAGRLDLDGVDQTIAALTASSTAASATNGLVISTGRTLTVNGGVTIGTNTDATIVLNGTGGGALVVNSGGANFLLGAATAANRNIVTADFFGLASFAAALGSGTMKLGDTNTSTIANQTSFVLATSNTITAAAISVGGNSGGSGSLHTLTLGSGANILNANALDIGMSGATTNRSSGLVQFAVSDTTGTVRIRGTDGTSRATVRMVDTAASTGSTTAGTLTLAGHEADVLAGTWTMASRSANTGNAIATLTFDRGTLDIQSLVMGRRTGSGTGDATATVSLGGGTSTIGSLTMAVNTSGGGTSTGTFNVSGGTVSIGSGSGDAINMATAAASRTATSALNLTGGSLTLAGNIVRSGSAGTETATITLDGGTLDLGGFSIGSAAAPISLVANAGSLGNLGELNGGGVLTKTTSGTLTLTGSNAYSGGTQLTAGMLRAGGAFAFGTAGITVGLGATLDLANFAVANPIANEVGTVINAVAFSGTSTVSGSTTFEGNVGGNVAVGAGGIASFNGAVNSLAVNAGGQAILGTGASLPQATLVNEGILTATQAGPLVIATAISGTGGLQQAGSGVTTLTGASSYTGLTSVTSGTLIVNGSIISNVSIGSSGVLGGSGSVGILSGSGLVGPGNSPGILEALSFDGSSGLDTAFEITALVPVYNAPTASLNDVLRLTSGTPFPASLTIENVIDVYFETAATGTYDGGFFTELSAVDLQTAVAAAQWRFWGRDPAGSQSYGGFSYKPVLDFAGITGFSVQTATRTVDFGTGPVTGSVTQFVIVPEPATLVLAATGIGLALALRRRRSTG